MGISTEYSSTVDHMNCSKTMVSGGQVPHLFLNRRPTELLKDDGILMQQMQFSESPDFREVQGSVWEPESHNVGVDRSCLRRLRLGIIKPCWKSDDIKRFPEDLTRKSPEDWMSRRATLPEVSPEESRKSQNPEDWISSGALFRKTELRRENFCGQDLLRPIL